MGDHSVGRAMVAVAEAIAERRKEGETALDILDVAADRSQVRGRDAEFDDAGWEDGPFRSLLLEAFGEDYDPATDVDGEGFYEGVWRPFSERYDLC